MKRQLSQLQRLLVAGIYIFIIVMIYGLLNGGIADILNQSEAASVWFFSGILLIIMGMYVTEPYFSSPTDTLSNSISLILVLLAITNRQELNGYIELLVYAVCMFILSIFHMVVKKYNEKAKRISFWCLKHLGSSKTMFSVVYLVSAFSFFRDNTPMLFAAIALWICMVPIGLVESIIVKFSQLMGIIKEKDIDSCIGVAIKNSESNLYTISVPKTDEKEKLVSSSRNSVYAVKVDSDSYCLGIEIQRKNLIDSTWISIMLLDNAELEITLNDLEDIGININYTENLGTAHVLNNGKIKQSILEQLKSSTIFMERDDFIGFVLPESNVSTIRFNTCKIDETRLTEGTIVKTHIAGSEVLYQVINGITKIASNSVDSEYGYICAVARKLGHYDAGHHEIKHVNWTPKVYEPVYLCKVNRDIDLQEIAKNSIGRLPGSDMSIPIKNINVLVTHNTAVLGILGVGKSCLTFELIKKIVAAGIKVICLDITNQYASDNGLYKYIPEAQIVSDLLQEKIDELESQSMRTGTSDSKSSWGNVENFKKLMESAVSGFMDVNNKSVMVLNPEKYIVRQAATDYKITELKDVSLVEKVQIISEIVLKKCMDLGQIDRARCCVVYEEAHSLTPEFNSVVVKDDNSHANGTAKVILQGRKYGLGCIIVTQRTANVTKSILNQCNTIFALRVFDDTGKSFLENYIGRDYSDTLPTLEERHAIVIGKGIGLKQPVILQLNDMKYLQTNDGEKIVEKNECVDVETEEIPPNL